MHMDNNTIVGRKVLYNWDKGVYEVISKNVHGALIIKDIKYGYMLKVYPEDVTFISNM